MAEYGDTNYCQRCGQALEQREFEGKPRPTCPSCGFIVFLDPKVAVVVLVSDGDRLLFVQRGAEPQIGKWCFPGGYVDRGEEVTAAAQREVREETGLKVEITGLIGVYSLPSNPVIVIAYSGSVRSGELVAGTDAEDAGWFEAGTLPELAFPHNVKIIEDWEAAQQAG
ncbi:MAG: NUDIX hydrolase [Chloroflexota bacterium]|nr:NUDIX hydrolase [Chloroflexota bacterium]